MDTLTIRGKTFVPSEKQLACFQEARDWLERELSLIPEPDDQAKPMLDGPSDKECRRIGAQYNKMLDRVFDS
jgi:hypothetical protein